MSVNYVRLPERDGELILAIRSQCPEDLLPDLHEYLLKHRPRAARLLPEWGGYCLHSGEILVDPDCHRLLRAYLHELAHATIGTRHGHNEHFAQVAEALYIRFRVEYTSADLLYDIHDMHEYFAIGEPAQHRASTARRLAQAPLTVEKLEELGQNADAAAEAAEWGSVLVPLFWLSLTVVPVVLFWLFRDHFPRFIQQWPLETAGVAACAFCLLVAFWPSRH